MPYVTSIERRALKKEREEGRVEGREDERKEARQKVRAKLLSTYQERWGAPPQPLLEAVDQIQEFEQLLDLFHRLVAAQNPDDWQS